MELKQKITIRDIQIVRTYLGVLQSIVWKEKRQKDIVKQIDLKGSRISEVVNTLIKEGLIEINNLTKKYYVDFNFLVRDFAKQMGGFKEEEIIYLIDLANSCKESIAKSRIPTIKEFLNLSCETDEIDERSRYNHYQLKKVRYSPSLLFLFLIMRNEDVQELDEKNKLFHRFLEGLWLISWEEEIKSSCKLIAKVLKNIKDEGFETLWMKEFRLISDSISSINLNEK